MMMLLSLALVVVAASCKKKEEATPAPATEATSSAPATTTSATVPTSNADDLAGLAQGAIVVRAAEPLSEGHSAYYMIDEDPHSTWNSLEGKPNNQSTVIHLAERCAIDRVEFDGGEFELETHLPKNVRVEMSDTSAEDGFKPIANVTLASKSGPQSFPADANVPGRFIKLTIVDNYGAAMVQLADFKAFGKKLTNTPLADLTGKYKSEWLGATNLKQNGAQVSGCYEKGKAPINGGVEGHVVRFQYKSDIEEGPGIMVFSTDGKSFFGGYWNTKSAAEHPSMQAFSGTRESDTPGTCPGDPKDQMTNSLMTEKRLRLYGINFDSDSDHIRDESKPTLDLVVSILKDHNDWKLTIEGHTDSTSTAEHNQQLSQSRANAVKSYLTNAGIDAARLTPQGLGATKPVASNDSALGRAANRRVELVRD